MNIQNLFKSQKLMLITAGYFTLILNLPFWLKLINGLQQQQQVSSGFVISLPIFLFSALTLIFAIIAWKPVERITLTLLLLLSSLVFYAELNFGAVFDYGMIENTLQTNSGEVFSYLNLWSVVAFISVGVLPAVWLWKQPAQKHHIDEYLIGKISIATLSLTVLAIIAAGYYSNYAAFGRNHSELKRYIIPSQYLSSGYKYVRDQLQAPLPYKHLGMDARHSGNNTPSLVVMVVGETARSQSFAYAGYQRNTTPFTQQFQPTFYKDIQSCGTATAVSVPCMFSLLTHDTYDARHADAQDNVLDIIQRAGVEVTWIDNDGGCKGVCNRVTTVQIDPQKAQCQYDTCFDIELLNQLKTVVSRNPGKHQLVVLHMIGSHGPTYYKRYPKSFARFSPDCQRSDIQNCSEQELINTYDNTIAYSDYVLSEIINYLNSLEELDTALMYMSDHGESLGEKGMYLHGAPYSLAPDEQTRVPAMVWLSDNYQQSNQLFQPCRNDNEALSQDNLSHTLLAMTQVNSKVYQQKMNMLSGCPRIAQTQSNGALNEASE